MGRKTFKHFARIIFVMTVMKEAPKFFESWPLKWNSVNTPMTSSFKSGKIFGRKQLENHEDTKNFITPHKWKTVASVSSSSNSFSSQEALSAPMESKCNFCEEGLTQSSLRVEKGELQYNVPSNIFTIKQPAITIKESANFVSPLPSRSHDMEELSIFVPLLKPSIVRSLFPRFSNDFSCNEGDDGC